MPVLLAPVLDCEQRAGKAAFRRHLPHHVLTVPRFPPRVGKAEEVERRVLAVWGRTITALRAKVDEARLVRMQRKAEPSKPFPQDFQYPLGVVVGLEGHHKVIGEPHQGRLPP